MSEVREYSYKIKGLSSVENDIIEKINIEFAQISGVIGFNVKKDEEIVEYALDQWSSDYDVFCKLSELCDEYNLELVFDDDEIIENDVAKEDENQDFEKQEVQEEFEVKNKLTKSDFAEKVIIALLSIGFLVVGSLLGKHPNVQPWILMLGFTVASYEILYDVIVKATEKGYVYEEILTFLGALIFTYQGKMVTSAVIMLIYSTLTFIETYAKHKVALKKEELICKISSASNEKEKAELTNKLEFIEKNEQVSSAKTLSLISKRKIFTLSFLALAILVIFVPPIFAKGAYWLTLSSKWLYLGACVLVLNGFGEMLFSLSHTEFYAIFNAIENDVEINSIDNFLEISTKNIICFDKSGVLVKDYKVESVTGDENTLVYVKSALNCAKNHLYDVVCEYSPDLTCLEVSDFNEHVGMGVSCKIDGSNILVGNKRLFKDNSINISIDKDSKSHIFVAKDGQMIGYLTLTSTIVNDSYGAVAEIKHDLGLKTEILSCDESDVVTQLKKELKVGHAVAGASPKYKADRVNKENAVYVGDELNDKHTLCQVDSAITFGNDGKIVVKSSSVRKVPFILKLAKRTNNTNKFNKKLIIIGKILLIACATVLRLFTAIDFIWWIFTIDVIIRAITILKAINNSSSIV